MSGKYIETQEENVVANVSEFEDHFEISGFVHVTFNNQKYEIDFHKIINKTNIG